MTAGRKRAGRPSARCPGCGRTLSALLRAKRMGCAACYTSFAATLEPLRVLLTGRGDPGGTEADRWQAQREAAVELQEAILTEDFERAAALRDTVRRLRT